MSRSTNSIVRSVNFCEFCDLVFETKKELYKHQLYDPKHKELLEKRFESDDDDQGTNSVCGLPTCFADDLIYVRSKTKSKTENESKAKTETKTETKPEPKTEAKTETNTKTETKSIVVCWVCGNKFKDQIGLQTHMNKQWRENVVLNDNYNFKSSINQKQLYITKSNDSFIKDFNEKVDYIIDKFKPFKSYKYKVTANCLYKKRDPRSAPSGSEEEKTFNINLRTDEYMNKYHRLNLNHRLDHVRETYEGYGYDYEFVGITGMQMNIERTKPSLKSYTELQPGLRDKTKTILNIRSIKFNCLQLCFTAALHLVTEHATRRNKDIANLIEDWEANEYAHNYLTKI